MNPVDTSSKPEDRQILRVMAEYASSGIWVVGGCGPFRHGMISHEKLSLPRELANGFNEWIDWYWDILDEDKPFDFEGFNSTGRALAIELKRFVGNDVIVLFDPEEPEWGDYEEEIIELTDSE